MNSKLKLMSAALMAVLFLGGVGCGNSDSGTDEVVQKDYPLAVTPHVLPYRISCTNEKAPDESCDYEHLQYAADLWNTQTGLNLVEVVENSKDVDILVFIWTDSDLDWSGFPETVVPIALQATGTTKTNVALVAKFIGFGLGMPMSDDPESVMYASAASTVKAGDKDFPLPKLTAADVDYVNDNLVK